MSEFILPVQVYYEDTDIGGMVYHANYLKFMERARTEWLRAQGFEQDVLMAEHDLMIAVRSAQLEFRRPARFNDALEVSVAVSRRGRASIDFVQQVRRDGEVLCQGEVRLACLGVSDQRPKPFAGAMLEFWEKEGV